MEEKQRRIIWALVSLFAFVLISFFVCLGKNSPDVLISSSILKIQNPLINSVFIFLDSELVLAVIALIFAVALYLQGKKASSLILVFSLCAGEVLQIILKIIVQRGRPAVQLVQESGYSFPSGHAVFSMILFSMLIYLYKGKIKSRAVKNIFIFAGIFLILLVGFSRIYLNAHWFTDVLGGYALGFFLVNFSFLFWEKLARAFCNF